MNKHITSLHEWDLETSNYYVLDKHVHLCRNLLSDRLLVLTSAQNIFERRITVSSIT